MNCVFAPSAPYSAGDIPILGAVKYVPGSTWTNVPERVQAGSLVQGLSFPCARGSGCLWLLSEKFCLTGSSLKMGDAPGCAAGFLLQLNWVLEGEEVRSASVHAARQAWSLLPFAGGREEISIPGRRRVFPAETWEPVPGPYQCSWGTGTSRTHQPTQARSLASWFGRA